LELYLITDLQIFSFLRSTVSGVTLAHVTTDYGSPGRDVRILKFSVRGQSGIHSPHINDSWNLFQIICSL